MPTFAGSIPLIKARFEAARAAASGAAWASWPWTTDNAEQSFQDQQTGPWVYLEIAPAGSGMTQFGSAGKRVVQDDGIIALHVFVAAGTGTDLAWDGASAMAEIFRMVKFAGVACAAPSPGQGGEGSSDGRWYRVTVTVPFATHYNA